MSNRVCVTSNNGTIHLAEDETNPTKENPKTKEKREPKYYPNSVRKLCDGQWISDKKVVKGKPLTCAICALLQATEEDRR